MQGRTGNLEFARGRRVLGEGENKNDTSNIFRYHYRLLPGVKRIECKGRHKLRQKRVRTRGEKLG